MFIKKIPNQIIKEKLITLNLKRVDAIAFHHMANRNWGIKDVEKYHVNVNGWSAIGYNYWIDFEGNIYEGRGLCKGAGVENHNSHIISVGFQGDFESQIPTDNQYESAADLVKYLKNLVPTIKTIGKHSDWNATECPGRNFDIKKITNPAAKELTSGNDLVWELVHGRLNVEINDVQRAVNALEESKTNPKFLPLYWIIRKIVNNQN